MYRRIITIHDNNRTFNGSEKIYSFGIDKNGNPDNLEIDILNTLKDMNKKGILDIIKLHKLLDYEYAISLSNVKENIKPVIINISDNLEFIKEKIRGE